MITRPPKSQTLLLPLILMAFSLNPHPTEIEFPANELLHLAQDMVLNNTLDLQAKDKLFILQDHLLLNYDMNSFCFQSLGIHPKYPFIYLYTFKPAILFPKELYFFLWYSVTCTILLSGFPLVSRTKFLRISWLVDS